MSAEIPDIYGPKMVDPATRPFKRIVHAIRSASTQRDAEAVFQAYWGTAYREAMKEGIRLAKRVLLKEIENENKGPAVPVPQPSGDGSGVAEAPVGAGEEEGRCAHGANFPHFADGVPCYPPGYGEHKTAHEC